MWSSVGWSDKKYPAADWVNNLIEHEKKEENY